MANVAYDTYIKNIQNHFGQSNSKIVNPYLLREDLAEFGNAKIDLGPQSGGFDFAAQEMVRIFELFGSIDLEFRDTPGAGHARLLEMCESPFSKAILKRVATGDAFVGIAMTEEAAGSDIDGFATNAILDGSQYCINGMKKYVARINHASHFIVFAKLFQDKAEPQLAAFLIPTENCVTKSIASMGHSNFSWGSIEFENLRVDSDSKLFSANDISVVIRKHFSYWRLMMAASAIGCAKKALSCAVNRLSKRKSFGVMLGEMTHLQNELAIQVSSVHSAWLSCEWAAKCLDSDSCYGAITSLVKAECVERAIAAVEWSAKVHGAHGYSTETDLEKRHRDLIGLRYADGANDALRCAAARTIIRANQDPTHYPNNAVSGLRSMFDVASDSNS